MMMTQTRLIHIWKQMTNVNISRYTRNATTLDILPVSPTSSHEPFVARSASLAFPSPAHVSVFQQSLWLCLRSLQDNAQHHMIASNQTNARKKTQNFTEAFKKCQISQKIHG